MVDELVVERRFDKIEIEDPVAHLVGDVVDELDRVDGCSPSMSRVAPPYPVPAAGRRGA
jgi:hypothetical protein